MENEFFHGFVTLKAHDHQHWNQIFNKIKDFDQMKGKNEQTRAGILEITLIML